MRAVLLDPSCSGSGTASADIDASLAAAAAALASGEGEGTRAAAAAEEDKEKQRRIEKLASFQLSALKHALQFPKAERVAYSTCSVHAKENERVVAAALAWLSGEGDEEKEQKKRPSSSSSEAPAAPIVPPPRGWSLARALPAWPNRGIPEEDQKNSVSLSAEDAAKVIRAHPATDGTDGFFVAVFER